MVTFCKTFVGVLCALSLVACGPTPSFTGTQLPAGKDGVNGSNGHSALVEATSAITCTNGGSMIVSGTDKNDDGTLQLVEITAQFTICNGLDGADGQNGTNGTNGVDGQNAPPTSFTPVAILDPCGDTAGIYDEVFLKLSNGTVLASFSDNVNGYNTRWSILVAGSYVTTDNSHCYFSVDAQGNLYNEHF